MTVAERQCLPATLLDDACGPLPRDVVRQMQFTPVTTRLTRDNGRPEGSSLCDCRISQRHRFEILTFIEVPFWLSTAMFVPVLGTLTLPSGWSLDQYDALSWNSGTAAWPRM